MTQLGESISVDIFMSNDAHDEKTCPWHDDSANKSPEAMPKPDPETDGAKPSMPANDGGKLGRNMPDKANGEIILEYAPDETVTWTNSKGKESSVQTYKKEIEIYDLQYAPHHLIPGNESLAVSTLGPYLGDDTVIKHFNKNGESSLIKDKQTVGYDVNRKENGVWLPSPYALSMSNKWPSSDGKKRILKVKGKEVLDLAVSFQRAYVAEAIHESGGDQFHMRHKGYSNEVKDILDGIAAKLELMTLGACPEAKQSEDDGKYDAPKGLVGRLDLLSAELKRLLKAGTWHSPFFGDDKIMKQYLVDLGISENSELKANVNKVL